MRLERTIDKQKKNEFFGLIIGIRGVDLCRPGFGLVGRLNLVILGDVHIIFILRSFLPLRRR